MASRKAGRPRKGDFNINVQKPGQSAASNRIGERLDLIDGKIKELNMARLDGANRYNHNNVDWNSFQGWHRFSSSVRDPDRARQALYFGFQPTYDLLISDVKPDESRTAALGLLDSLVQAGIEYLRGYYIGQPDVYTFRERLQQLEPFVSRLQRARYQIKFRNVDYNGITPQDIQLFLRQFMENILNGGSVPDYIVGCACGSSEIAMPLSGMLGTDLGFIRRSYRRGDSDPRIIREQEREIAASSNGREVLCVEDYLCTGESLYRVMGAIRGYEAASVRGASVNEEPRPHVHGLRVDLRRRKLQLYSFAD